MQKNYTAYSKKRKAIMQQVGRLERHGFVVPEKYHLPTVAQLREQTPRQRSATIRRVSKLTTETVRKYSYKLEEITTKTGKVKAKKVSVEAVRKQQRSVSAKKTYEARKQSRRKAREEYDYSEPKYDVSVNGSGQVVFVDRKTGEVTTEDDLEFEQKLNQWAIDFIDSAPDEDKVNASKYVEAVINGDVPVNVSGYDEWKTTLGIEPTAKNIFNMKMIGLKAESPNTAEWLEEIYQKYSGAKSDDIVRERIENAEGGIPDFDFHYSSNDVSIGAVIKMARIIKGSPISGAEARALAKAVDLDQSDYVKD